MLGYRRTSHRGGKTARGWAVVVGIVAMGVSSHALADGFNVGSLPALQWWASAQNSQLGQNPDGSVAAASARVSVTPFRHRLIMAMAAPAPHGR